MQSLQRVHKQQANIHVSKEDKRVINNTHTAYAFSLFELLLCLLIGAVFDHTGVTICDVRLSRALKTVSAKCQTHISVCYDITHCMD